jgi:hypothetical protein
MMSSTDPVTDGTVVSECLRFDTPRREERQKLS